jgi:hypothetical protein
MATLSISLATNVIDFLLFDALADTASRKLIKLMLPRGKVSVSHVLKIVASLSGRKTSERIQVRSSHLTHNTSTVFSLSSLQAMLLRWIVTIYDLIDSKDKFAKVYGVLFHFLDSELLR